MGANTWGQPEPQWEFRNEGKEIQQLTNSAPGIAIGSAQMAGVDFEGTFYVGPHEPLDNDFIGFIFSLIMGISYPIEKQQSSGRPFISENLTR